MINSLRKIDFKKLLISEETIRKPSVMVLIFSICFSVLLVDLWKPYNQNKGGHNFHWDVFNYYSYLPAYFCNDGKFEWESQMSNFNPYGPLGTHIPKCSYGLSVMYAPFFALGYKVAYNQKSPMNGFSEPFATCIHWGSIFYVLLGMFFLRKFLVIYFNEVVTAITLTAVLFGSMLFNYAFVQSELAHGYLFCLFSIFLYLTHKWHQKVTYGRTFWIGLVIGLITLIRPTELFIFLFFLLWNVKSGQDLKTKFWFLISHYRHFLLIALLMVLWWVPQLLFFKQHAGTYFYFAYLGERFFWDDPQIINVLFSYRKGLLIYTPLVLLAFVGIFFIKKDFPLARLSFVVVLSLVLYVLSCWWDWTFGGCFGARAYCQQIAILAIPLASLLEFIFYSPKKFIFRGLAALVIVVFICSAISLNMGQTYQYQFNRKIHPWGTSKKIYWKVLRTYQFTDLYNHQWWGMLNEPNYENYSKGLDRDK